MSPACFGEHVRCAAHARRRRAHHRVLRRAGARAVPRHARRHGPHRPRAGGRVPDDAWPRRGSGRRASRCRTSRRRSSASPRRRARVAVHGAVVDLLRRRARALGRGLLMKSRWAEPGEAPGPTPRWRGAPDVARSCCRAGRCSRGCCAIGNCAQFLACTARARGAASCIRRRASIRSTSCASGTASTARATIAPTVRHAIRISSHTAVFEHATASQATVSSKPKVCPAVMTRPRHRHHGGTVLGAVHPRRVGLQPHPHRPPNPAPASGAGPHPGRRTAPSARSGRSGPANPAAAAHARSPPPPRHARSRRRPTRRPRSPSAYRHPAAHAIASHCARRFLALRFLTLDKPETLSDNDVRPSSTCYTPTEVSESPFCQAKAENGSGR